MTQQIAYVYILQCRQNKYYVGKTVNPILRMENHFFDKRKNSVEWLNRYKPMQMILLLQIPTATNYQIYENSLAVLVSEKVGHENVRGGFFYSKDSDQICINRLRRFRESNTKEMASALRSMLPYTEDIINRLAKYDPEELNLEPEMMKWSESDLKKIS